MAEILLKNLTKIFDKTVVAVDRVDLAIHDQEFVVLVGPSGCGKSTILRMIAGLETCTEGEIYIDGRLVNELTPRERDVAMVFQNYALYPHLTVYDNMAFSLQLRREKKSVVDRRVREAAEILGIGDLLQRKPKALSGGQRQRVAIGRAIVREPKVFLMDEPLSNLDAKLRNQMRMELIQLRERLKATFVYVTHDQTEAMTLGDRIVVMKDGVLQQSGTPRQVFAAPANTFVAGFIGTPQMNLLHGTLLCQDGRWGAAFCGGGAPLPAAVGVQLSAAATPGEVLIGVRPENLHPAAETPERLGTVRMEIEVCELMGGVVQVHGRAEGQELAAVLPAEAGMELRRGMELTLAYDAQSLLFFDAASGRSLLSGALPATAAAKQGILTET